MRIIVCVKQVPDTDKVKIDKKTGVLIRLGVPSVLNGDDINSVEEAVRIKNIYDDVEVIAITMGPPQAESSLRECIARGVDKAILLSDRAFAGADTIATSNVLRAAIEKIGDYDIVFTGSKSTDGETGQVGPQVAEKLKIPQVMNIQKINIVEDGLVLVQRQIKDGYEEIEVNMPVLLSAVKELNEPCYLNIRNICDAYQEEIDVWNFEDIGLDKSKIGMEGSRTVVLKSFSPEVDGNCTIFEGELQESVNSLAEVIKDELFS
jgi:electron transfer flavoprotein beta subunit